MSGLEPNITGRDLAERIRDRAYECFKRRNGAPGDELSDWFQAEREISAEHADASKVFGSCAASERPQRRTINAPDTTRRHGR